MTDRKESRIINLLFGMQNPLQIIPGLLLAVVITLDAFQMTNGMAVHLNLRKNPVSAIMLAIILGIIIRNLVHIPQSFQPGIGFGLKKLLRLASS